MHRHELLSDHALIMYHALLMYHAVLMYHALIINIDGQLHCLDGFHHIASNSLSNVVSDVLKFVNGC